MTNGFRSDWGAKVYADLCSIVATGRLNGRSPFAAIRAALTIRSDPARRPLRRKAALVADMVRRLRLTLAV